MRFAKSNSLLFVLKPNAKGIAALEEKGVCSPTTGVWLFFQSGRGWWAASEDALVGVMSSPSHLLWGWTSHPLGLHHDIMAGHFDVVWDYRIDAPVEQRYEQFPY